MTNALLDTIQFYHNYLKTPVTPVINSRNKKRVVPYIKNYQNTTLQQSIDFLNNNGFNDSSIKGAAVILKPDYIVIDVDVKNGVDGKSSLNDMSGYYDFDFYNNSAIIVNSANNGLHLYYKLPEKYKIKSLRKALKSFIGVEFLVHKITMPNSKLANGKTYKFVKKTTNFMELPINLLDDLEVKTKPSELLLNSSITQNDHKIDLKRFEVILSKQNSIHEGSRSNEIYSLACLAKEHGLTKSTAIKILTEFNNKKIHPSLEQEELEITVTNAYNYSQTKTATKSIKTVFPQLSTNSDQLKNMDSDNWQNNDSWREKLYLVQKGTVISTHKFVNKNIKLFLENLDEFKNQIKLDEQTQKIIYKRKPLSDDNILEIREYLTNTEAFDPSLNSIHEAVRTVALQNKFHPVKDYFNSLPKWDNTKRLSRFFPDYCGSEDNSYTQELGELIFTAIVTRTFNAGCVFDFMPVLVGEQNRGKSLVTKYLAIKPEWYTDSIGNINNGDYIYQIMGKLVVECAELIIFDRASDNEIKAFVSRTSDEKRLAYQRIRTEIPRQFILIGTSNNTHFLRDPTGSRRFLPIEIKGGFRGENYQKQLPLFYSEALHYYKQKRPLKLLKSESLKILNKERDERYEQDPFSSKISEWLVGYSEVTVLEIWEKCMQKDFSIITKKDQSRIASILRKLNWKRTTKRLDGQVIPLYKKDNNT